MVPGVLYGGDKAPVAISVNERDFRKSLYTGKLLGHLVTLKYGTESQPVIARDVQFDPTYMVMVPAAPQAAPSCLPVVVSAMASSTRPRTTVTVLPPRPCFSRLTAASARRDGPDSTPMHSTQLCVVAVGGVAIDEQRRGQASAPAVSSFT
jgi:hypothetical protein